MSPVVARELPVRDFVEVMLTVCGMDAMRIRELLRAGSMVQGASRFRWQQIECGPGEVQTLLDTFPKRDASRPFAPARCVRAVLHGTHQRIEIERVTAGRRLLRKRSFWQALMELASASPLEYIDYSYREQGDEFRWVPEASAVSALAPLLKFRALARQIEALDLRSVSLVVERG